MNIALLSDYMNRKQAIEYIRSKGFLIGDGYLSYLANRKSGPTFQVLGSYTYYHTFELDKWIQSPQFRRSLEIQKIRASA
jgi:hypothetical protein